MNTKKSYTVVFRFGKKLDEVSRTTVDAENEQDARDRFSRAYPKYRIIAVNEDKPDVAITSNNAAKITSIENLTTGAIIHL